MDSPKYIGMEVHKETVSIAVMNSVGKLVESILETKTATILQFIQGLRGNLHVTFEEKKKNVVRAGCRENISGFRLREKCFLLDIHLYRTSERVNTETIAARCKVSTSSGNSIESRFVHAKNS